MALRERYSRVGTFKEGLIFGTGFAIAFIAILLALTLFLGNQEQRTLQEISQLNNKTVAIGRAQVCVLLQPVDPEAGRDESQVNSICLVPNGVEPGDWDDDGRVELDGP